MELFRFVFFFRRVVLFDEIKKIWSLRSIYKKGWVTEEGFPWMVGPQIGVPNQNWNYFYLNLPYMKKTRTEVNERQQTPQVSTRSHNTSTPSKREWRHMNSHHTHTRSDDDCLQTQQRSNPDSTYPDVTCKITCKKASTYVSDDPWRTGILSTQTEIVYNSLTKGLTPSCSTVRETQSQRKRNVGLWTVR